MRLFGIALSFDNEAGVANSKNSIYVVLNQTSFLDSLVTPLIPVKPIQGIINFEFALYPVLGWMMTITSFVIVRQWPWQAKRTLNKADSFLKGGGNMVISIEGKRSRDGKLGEYKKGPIIMALTNQSTIVPVVIEGTRALLPYRSLRVKPGAVTLRFLPSISTIGFAYEDRNELLNRVSLLAQQAGLR